MCCRACGGLTHSQVLLGSGIVGGFVFPSPKTSLVTANQNVSIAYSIIWDTELLLRETTPGCIWTRLYGGGVPHVGANGSTQGVAELKVQKPATSSAPSPQATSHEGT